MSAPELYDHQQLKAVFVPLGLTVMAWKDVHGWLHSYTISHPSKGIIWIFRSNNRHGRASNPYRVPKADLIDGIKSMKRGVEPE